MGFSREYRLSTPSGMEVTLLEAGASIASVRVPDRSGAFANVVLPMKSPGDPSYAGAVLAPYAGRIAGGRLDIDGTVFQLSQNEGSNHLHGGFHALSHRLWQCEGRMQGDGVEEVSFSAVLQDGEDGYPGNRRFTATYSLWDNQSLTLLLTAVTDKPTRVNLSSHAYFNLSGDFTSDISRHRFFLNADEVYTSDGAFLVAGREAPPPALDFKQMREIGAPCGHPQLDAARGLNHCYILSRSGRAPSAVLLDPASGRRMQLYTDQPCVMVYSGGYLTPPNCAIALEAQEHPLCPFAPRTPALYPGKLYQRRIVYRFDTVPQDTAP